MRICQVSPVTEAEMQSFGHVPAAFNSGSCIMHIYSFILRIVVYITISCLSSHAVLAGKRHVLSDLMLPHAGLVRSESCQIA